MLRRASPILRYFPYLLFLLAFLLAYSTWQPLTNNPVIPRIVSLAMIIFGLADWLLLAFLPRLGLSYGSIELSWFMMLCGRLVYLLAVVLPLEMLLHFNLAIRNSKTDVAALIAWTVINLAASAIEYYSLYIEPFDLRVTTLKLPGPAFFRDRPLRVLQLADPHIERITRRDRQVLNKVKELKPDLIVLTGDYLNYDYATDPRAIRDGRAFLSQLQAPRGVYAISGSRFVDRPETMAQLFDNLKIIVLNDQAQTFKIGGGELYLVGVRNENSKTRDRLALTELMKPAPPGAYTLLLYHTPDLIEAAAENGVNLYLAGHTHGGQIRFPLIGAVVTLSAYGRKYASGRHTLGLTTLYTCRGLGLEGLNLPRARFLCPPEMVIIELGHD